MFTKVIVAAVLLCVVEAAGADDIRDLWVEAEDYVQPETVLGLYEYEGIYNGRAYYTNRDYDLGWSPLGVSWELAPTGMLGDATEPYWEQGGGLELQSIDWGPYYAGGGSGSFGTLLVSIVPEPTTLVLLAMAAVAVLVARRRRRC